MVARRHKRRKFASADEAARAALAAAPAADEDPAVFWGPHWKEELQESLDDAAAGRIERFCGDEEFLAALEHIHQACQRTTGPPGSGATSNP